MGSLVLLDQSVKLRSKNLSVEHNVLKTVEELGEVCQVIVKEGHREPQVRAKIAEELGDVF